MHNRTVAELEDYTDFPEFERLCADLLTGVGYRGIDPQGIQGKDGGKDALHISDEDYTVFHFSTREDWESKLYEDLDKVKSNKIQCTKFVFVSNREISGPTKDRLKESVRNDYGWKLEIFDVERLRVVLDTHRQELRKKYLGIPISYSSHVKETIESFADDRGNDTVRHMGVGSPYQRVLILSIPNSRDDYRMGLFDQQFNFVGDQAELDEILSNGVPSDSSVIDSRIRSDHYSNRHQYQPQQNSGGIMPVGSMFQREPIIHECNIYDSGVLEGMYDVTDVDLTRNRTQYFLSLFFKVLQPIYEGTLEEDDHLTIAFQLLNAHRMQFEKNEGVVFSGESWLFRETEQDRFSVIQTNGFQERYCERTLNKVEHFFNEDPDVV